MKVVKTAEAKYVWDYLAFDCDTLIVSQADNITFFSKCISRLSRL